MGKKNSTGTEVAPITTSMDLDQKKEIFGDPGKMEGIELRLPQIKIAHQNQYYQLPDGAMVPTFKGIILDIVNVNAYWATPFDESGGNEPPQCFSMDGVRPSPLGEEIQADYCSECPMNKFGSDGGRGKGCKNMKRVHVIFENELFPKRITVPPSSLESFNVYGSRLADQRIPYQGVVTVFGLKQSKNKDGIAYSEITLTDDGFSVGSKEDFDAVMTTRANFMEAMRAVPLPVTR